jgi:hypothetical protein
MKEVLDLVVKDRDAQEDIDHELNEYNSTSKATKLELGEIFIVIELKLMNTQLT